MINNKSNLNALNRLEERRMKKYYLNEVRRLKEDITALTLEIQAEKEKQSVKVSTLYAVKVSTSKNNNRTPLDLIEKLEYKKELLTKKYHIKQVELYKKLTHRKQGTITNLMLDYYINCRDLKEMQDIYNIDTNIINRLLNKYATRLEIHNITITTYDKGIISYAVEEEPDTIQAFLFKDQYSIREYNLIYGFLEGKEVLYYDILLNYLIRYEFDINMICKIYSISMNDMYTSVGNVVNELDKYLKDNNYLK